MGDHKTAAQAFVQQALYYTYLFMTLLLIGVFTFFLTHTFLWAYRALKERIQKKGGM